VRVAGIRLEGLTKRFDDGTVAVLDVDLEIEDGEFFVLVGPSGCGKSTLLNLIVGLESATQGDVFVDGERVTGVDPRKRNMAMVFQSYAIYPHLTVRENLAFPLKIAGIPPDQRARRVAEAARVLELDELLDRRPATLSGGQRQRVSMGRAMVRDPVAFLLDEPLSNLDARLRGQMRTEIARLHRRLRTTTVYVTHDQTEALTLADRLAVLHAGKIQQVGTPREVYRAPANRFVATFLGAPPMNLLHGARNAGDLVLPCGRVPWPSTLPDGVAAVDTGVRPEDLREVVSHTGPATDDALRFVGRVELVEWLGADSYAHVELTADGGSTTRVVARLSPGSAVEVGDEVGLEVAARSLHFFDPDTGDRLGVP